MALAPCSERPLMPARRRRRPGSDRLYVTTEDGLPLGHLDLTTGESHDVPAVWRERFVREANGWLWHNDFPPIAGTDGDAPALEAGVEAPEGGWDRGWDDLALHLPGHGLAGEAARARTTGTPDADRPSRLRADGQHAVDDALAKLTRGRPGLGRVRRPRWRILHAVEMNLECGPGSRRSGAGPSEPDTQRSGAGPSGTVLIDHIVIGPAGVFVVEVRNHPGGRAVIRPDSLEIDDEQIDLVRRRKLGDEAARRLSAALADAAGAAETLNPPPVTPVVAVVGAIVVGLDRPRGVLISRAGVLPRILQAFGTPLVDQAVTQVYEVARRSSTWTW